MNDPVGWRRSPAIGVARDAVECDETDGASSKRFGSCQDQARAASRAHCPPVSDWWHIRQQL